MKNNRTASTLIKVLIVLAIVGTLVALLLPATRTARESTHRSACQNNLKQIALALLNYAEKHGTLPPAYTTDAEGKPLHSWRTLILPDLGEMELYKKIDLTKRWDDPVNAEAAKASVPVFMCPSSMAEAPATSYLAVVTPNNCLRAKDPRKVSQIPGETIMVVDVDSEHAVPWMQPVDADEERVMNLRATGKYPHAIAGFYAAFVDGQARCIYEDVSNDELLAMLRVADKNQAEAAVGK